MFRNRKEAGNMLAMKLNKYRDTDTVILAVPRGGVPVAFEIAEKLNVPMELIWVKKLGHPFNPEYAIGAVSLHGSFVVPHDDVNENYIQSEIQKVRLKLEEMKKKFSTAQPQADLKGKTVIIVDDGIATGNTLLALTRTLREAGPAKIVIAAPVAARQSVQKLKKEVDEVCVLLVPDNFFGVGAFYEDFTQVRDEEVMDCLEKLRAFRKAG